MLNKLTNSSSPIENKSATTPQPIPEGIIPTTPQKPWQIFGQAARLYRRGWLPFTAVAGVGYGLLLALLLMLGLAASWIETLESGGAALLLSIGVVGGGVLLLAAYLAMTAALMQVVIDQAQGQPASIAGAYRRVWRQRKHLGVALSVWLVMLVIIAISGGIPLLGWLVAPGLLLCAVGLLSITPAVVLIEQLPGPWAVARTWGLARSRLFFTVGTLVLLAGLGGGLLLIPTLAMMLLGLPLQLSDGWLPLLLIVFYLPFYSNCVLLIYFDLRLRRETPPADEVTHWLTTPPPLPETPGGLYRLPNRGGLLTMRELGVATLFSLLLALLLGLSWVAAVQLPPALDSLATADTLGGPAPDFTLATLDGDTVSLQSLRGKPTVINFWATWCPPCKKELPILQAAYLAHNERINFVAISIEETSEIVAPFVEEVDLRVPVLLDPEGVSSEAYEIRGLPTTVFVDAEGVVVNRHLGELNDNTLAGYLQPLLE